MRIVVAMSGGVDSSVAAAMLAADGHTVIGLSMQLYDQTQGDRQFGSCCTIDDLADAGRVAIRLGIPHYIVNFERGFDETVVSNFVAEYAAGRTPIPCVRCNGDLKFSSLLERARGLDADSVATGHYARVEVDPHTGRRVLRRGADRERDQSYFLFSLTQAQLGHARFPLGSMTKAEVRGYARTLDLPVADKPDSQEICFVPDGDYASFVERRAPLVSRAGHVTDASGRVLGRHDGIHRFTVGQRRGLGLAVGARLYVLEIRPESNTVVVGSRDELERPSLTASGVNWIDGDPPSSAVCLRAQIRHRHPEAAARVVPLAPDRMRVEFDTPQQAVAPGQAVVLYEGDRVVGGGWID
jgi:tRNA-specific 2-thiouridylase